MRENGGTVKNQGPIEEVLQSDVGLQAELAKEAKEAERTPRKTQKRKAVEDRPRAQTE